MTTHNGAYAYDGAGRISQVVDTAAMPATTEVYTWNNDGTLASSPGPGYTRLFFYDEEQHLTRIQHNTAGTITMAYDYGYAAAGGRRWQKDYANNVWTWYPCGVACSAGELVEQTSDLTVATWTTSALYLKSGITCSSNLIRRNSEYHQDILGNIATFTGSTGTTLASLLSDTFGVQRYVTGTAQSSWSALGYYIGVEGMLFPDTACVFVPERALNLRDTCQQPPKQKKFKDCQSLPGHNCDKCCEDVAKALYEAAKVKHDDCMAIHPNDPKRTG